MAYIVLTAFVGDLGYIRYILGSDLSRVFHVASMSHSLFYVSLADWLTYA